MDRLRPPTGVQEPVSVHSRVPLFLWLASAVFIVYGTTIPFRFVSDPAVLHAHLSRLTLDPFVSPDTGRRVSIPDFTGNVLLFVPFGLFGVWANARPRNRAVRLVAVVAVGAVLSAGVEALQLFTLDRVSSIADLLANTLGAFGGAIAGTILAAAARASSLAAVSAGWTDSSMVFPLLVAAAVMLGGAWEPFDVTLDPGSVLSKIRLFVHDPVQLGPLTDEALSILQHLLFTSTLVLWLSELGVASSAAAAAIVGVTVAVAAEASQLFIAARMPGVWDAAVGSAGALTGVLIGMAFGNSSRRRPWRWCGSLIALTAIGAGMQQLSPFHAASDPRPFQWMPFLNYYEFTTSETVSHSAELLLAYFPLGFGVALTVPSGKRRLIAAIGTALAIAAPVEYLQRFVGGRFPDVTDIAMSVAGACAGAWVATGGWRLFNEEIAIVSRQARAASRTGGGAA